MTRLKYADQAEWKHCLVSTFVVRMQQLHFLLTTRIFCLADYWLLAVECLWMIKLKKNKTIISVLVRTESMRRYNENIFIFAIKVMIFKR